MSRELTTDMVTEVEGLQLRPIVLIKAEFDGGDLLLWSGIGSLSYGGDTYTGGGTLLNISEIKEVTNIEAQGATFALSGINSSVISTALNEDYQSRPITCYFGCLNGSGAIIADPTIMFKGRMDVLQIDDGGDTATLSMRCENRLIDLRRTRVRRYTDEDQKTIYPLDDGLEFVPSLQEKEIIWGKK